jgi:hypothetical protein
LCIYACDTFFEICYQEDNFNSSHCSQKVVTSTWSNDNKIFNSGQNALGDGIPNPLTFRFQQQWSVSSKTIFCLVVLLSMLVPY